MEEETFTTSGNDIIQSGSEAFVFIDIDSWTWAASNWGFKARDDVIRKIMVDVEKSLKAVGHDIFRLTTCMTRPDPRSGDWPPRPLWNPAVDYVFNWSPGKDDNLETWAKACLPRTKPIIFVSVADEMVVHEPVIAKIQSYSKTLAVHRPTYPCVHGEFEMASKLYERDPEGTVTVWKDPSKSSDLLYLKD